MRTVALAVALCACAPPAPEPPPPPPAPEVVAEPAPAGPDGRELFVRRWVPDDPRSHGADGLGPRANDTSCVGCHAMGGPGGAGGRDRNARVSVDGLGRAVPAPRLGGGPRGSSERNTPALWGAGAVDAVPDDVIEAGAGPVPGWPTVAGRVARDADGAVARFGWRGTTARLATFVAQACAFELGLDVPGQPQPGPDGLPGAPGPVDLDQAELDALTAFVGDLPAPSRLEVPGAEDGERLFAVVGCASCHRPALGELEGVYSDLLLHDLGSELADRVPSSYGGRAVVEGGRRWRTPPLWGVADSAPWMHDGRAETLGAAIALHEGEALASRTAWERLSEGDQWATLAFLGSLTAPVAP